MPTQTLRNPAVVTIMFTALAAIAAAGVVELTVGWLERGTGAMPALVAAAVPAVMVPLVVYPIARSRIRLRDPDHRK